MQMAYILGGSNPHLASVRIGESVSANQPLIGAADGGSGAIKAAVDGAIDFVGIAQEAGTHTTTQATDGSDIDRTVKVIINPDAVWKAKLSGGSGEDTAMGVITATAADATGLLVTDSGTDTTTFDNGTIWGLSGSNAGQARKIDALSGNELSVLVPFLGISIGDTFLGTYLHQFGPNMTAQLTTNLTQIDSGIGTDPATDVELTVIDLLTNGRNDSFALVLFKAHVLHRGAAGAI